MSAPIEYSPFMMKVPSSLTFRPSSPAEQDIPIKSVMEDLSRIRRYAKQPPPKVDATKVLTPIEKRLEQYILGAVTDRIPLLIGNTAVLKSASVQALAVKHGMRLVDIRAAFMSRFDFEGLTEKTEVDGKTYSYNAPMQAIMECTIISKF